MFFVTIILIVLTIVFYIWSKRAHNHELLYLAICFLLAAIGTGIVEFFALSALR
ncbi:hypothetical protein HYS28_00295 [Candidatus Uhrbacteria bacterium]|nr:hypothetical protein [Candidatus Uhrbacteria bacterium]